MHLYAMQIKLTEFVKLFKIVFWKEDSAVHGTIVLIKPMNFFSIWIFAADMQKTFSSLQHTGLQGSFLSTCIRILRKIFPCFYINLIQVSTTDIPCSDVK